VATLMAKEAGWSADRQKNEIENYNKVYEYK